jgi:pimeloyl-ACP methyl ester carboxylesterase
MMVGELDNFYREAGRQDAPTLLLLHGFPTVRDMLALILDRHAPEKEMRRLVEIPALAAVWREEFQARLDN